VDRPHPMVNNANEYGGNDGKWGYVLSPTNTKGHGGEQREREREANLYFSWNTAEIGQGLKYPLDSALGVTTSPPRKMGGMTPPRSIINNCIWLGSEKLPNMRAYNGICVSRTF
jgi:hypothetical protein